MSMFERPYTAVGKKQLYTKPSDFSLARPTTSQLALKREKHAAEQKKKYQQKRKATLLQIRQNESKALLLSPHNERVAIIVKPIEEAKHKEKINSYPEKHVKKSSELEKVPLLEAEEDLNEGLIFENLPKTPHNNRPCSGTNHESPSTAPIKEPKLPSVPLKDFLNELTNPSTPLEKRKHLLMSPYPVEYGMLECTVQRDKSGFAQKMYPKYTLLLSGSYKYLLSAKKVSFISSAHYVITTSTKEFCRKNAECLGKLRSNLSGSEYNVFDQGENPGLKMPYDKNAELSSSRKMQVLLPKMKPDGTITKWKPIHEAEHLIQQYKNGKKDNITNYVNKSPEWNNVVEAYSLDFNGRVSLPSIKNFQLVEPDKPDDVYLQFGRVDEDLFNLDLKYPFSIFQAFAVALSAFDFKYACD